MDGFHYKDGCLMADDCGLDDIAAEYGTPCYVYLASSIRNKYRKLVSAFEKSLGSCPLIAFACKANSNQAILTLLARLGAGSDIVSGGELKRCLAAGIPAEKIVFSGVSKSDSEIALAVKNGIRQINIESENELYRISAVAESLGVRANITFRFNPDVDAQTNNKISTGRAQDKFGLLEEDILRLYGMAARMPQLNLKGLHVHIGSQIIRASHFKTSFERLGELAGKLIGKGLPLDTLDLGGGLGVRYRYRDGTEPDLEEYAAIIASTVVMPGVDLVVEPGRYLVADAGVLLSRTLYVKESGGRKFAVLDAGMNDLIRPALYDAWHEIQPLSEPGHDLEVYDVVGPVCETGDTFALRREMPLIAGGDLVAIRNAGAYGAVMASNYNTRPFAPEVLVEGNRRAVIRPRQTDEELVERDSVPGWL